MKAINLRRVDLTGWALILLVVLSLTALALFHGGCVSQHDPFRPGEPGAGVPSTGTDPVGALVLKLGLISWICLLIGIGGIIASYVGPIAAFVPRKAAVIAFGVGLGLAFVQAWIESLGKHLFWITTGLTVAAVGGCIAAAWPWLLAWRNKVTGQLAPHAAAAAGVDDPVVAPASPEVKP